MHSTGMKEESKHRTQQTKFDYDDDDDELIEENTKFIWSNLMFIPFNTVFLLAVVVSSIVKSVMGPLASITPELYCVTLRNETAVTVLTTIKPYLTYVCDPVYFIDTFLHIVHKQVEDKARQREHLPKSSVTILLDIFALIPFFRLISSDECAEITLWPNILHFNEFLLIYRVIGFFASGMKHSVLRNLSGSVVIGLICINAISCFWLLLTYEGFCKQCKEVMIDWRMVIIDKVKTFKTVEEKYFYTYFSAAGYFTSVILQTLINNVSPILLSELVIVNFVIILAYLSVAFFAIPSFFAENCQRNSIYYRFRRHMARVVNDSLRRTSDPNTVATIKSNFYLVWAKRNAITKCPNTIRQLPRYLSVEIKEDLCWPLFYHSPTLRRTSVPFKRWICDYINFEYKMPGESFFINASTFGKIYYIKSGIVQIISSDDGVTPLLSMAGGTVLGDVNFFVPALQRNILVRCLTYCEVYYLPRKDIFTSMGMFLKDKAMIMYKIKQRLQHARNLFALKNRVRGTDRSEDENITWVKKRWWKILEIVQGARRKASALSDAVSFEIPAEETIYHCSKYLGQLVLCTDEQLQNKSTFVTAQFPWIFVPDSTFAITWHKIVQITVYMVLFVYPPTMIQKTHVFLFPAFDAWVNFIYFADIILKLVTAPPTKDDVTSFTIVMFTRCKDAYFLMDLLSTPLLNEIVMLSGLANYDRLFRFNRLIKTYVLFKGSIMTKDDLMVNPLITSIRKKIFMYFTFTYVSCFFVFILCFKSEHLSHVPFFCYLPKPNLDYEIWHVLVSWIRESSTHKKCLPESYQSIYLMIVLAIIGFVIKTHTKSHMISAFYLSNIEFVKYQFFVSQLKTKYRTFKIHPSLLKRLEKYLSCYWTAYSGLDLMSGGLVHGEPFHIYWKGHGEKAVDIITKSEIFLNSDEEMIKELAFRARFIIYPKDSLLYLYGCPFDTVAWLVNGYLACEYQNEQGKSIQSYWPQGQMISVVAVFFGRFSVRTFIAATDVEILYMRRNEFFDVLNRYPREMELFQNCFGDIQPAYEKIYARHFIDMKHERNIRLRIFQPDVYLVNHESALGKQKDEKYKKTLIFFLKYRCWIHPKSRYYHGFILFRISIIFLSIISSSVLIGAPAFYSHILWNFCLFNNYVTYVDMVLKLFLAHYDHRGLLIYHWKKRFLHYVSHTFAFDLIGSVPWYTVTNYLIPRAMNQTYAHFFNTSYRCIHIYLINGYFDYVAYWPNSNLVKIKCIKWVFILTLIIVTAAQFYMIRCVDIKWKDDYVTHITFTNETCWISPNTWNIRPNLENRNLTMSELRNLFAESLLIVSHSFMRTAITRFHFRNVDRKNADLIIVSGLLGVMYWFFMTYIISLLVLNSRGLSIFLDSITQLENFLKGERIEPVFIKSVVDHYKYVWYRSNGVTVKARNVEGIGLILRQDLSYFFYKRTLDILDSQLKLGSSLKWVLAFYCNPIYFLANEDIMRENDVVDYIYIVHRGVVTIFQNRKRIASLEKGSIFGQLESTKKRPVKVTALARDNTDVLVIEWNKFQELITDKARQHITQERTYISDYIAIRNAPPPDPYNTIQYLLRESKTISYPWMKNNTCNVKTSKYYAIWLIIVWLLGPWIAVSLSMLTVLQIPYDVKMIMVWCLLVVDFLFLLEVVVDYFYAMELVVYKGHPVYKYNRLHKFKHWGLYVDILSLVLPISAIYFNLWYFQLARLLRIRFFFLFYQQFFSTIQSQTKPIILFFLCIVLSLHTLVCLYIYFACENKDGFYHLPDYPKENIPYYMDIYEWTSMTERKIGCACIIRYRYANTTYRFGVRVKNWYGDYLIALTGLLQVMSLFSLQSDLGYYKHESTLFIKAFINLCLTIIDILILSKSISMIYIKFRKLYKYKKTVDQLLTFLKSEGLSPTLEEIVTTYMSQLWDRQRGNWLPELAFQAPQCLREDIMGTLYIHHLQKPPIFRDIPNYFMRQLVSRFHRVVIFPGKYIVRAGDILPRLYFIHEGDIEKHYVNSKGEIVTTHLLTTNGYFGFIPGMPKGMSFSCSYYTRTVVDAVYIKVEDWLDLLEIYKDVKTYLDNATVDVKNEL